MEGKRQSFPLPAELSTWNQDRCMYAAQQRLAVTDHDCVVLSPTVHKQEKTAGGWSAVLLYSNMLKSKDEYAVL